MRTTGNPAGQVKPKPSPASRWAERSCEVTGARAPSWYVPLKSPSTTTRGAGSARTAAASARAASLRRPVVKPAPDTRTEARWAAYTATGPSGVSAVARIARVHGMISTSSTAVSRYLLQRPTPPSTVWCG